MGIAAELREPANLREGLAEIAEEAMDGRSICAHSVGSQGEGQCLDLCFEDLLERGWG
jgi:hypothetical protein